MIYHHFNATGHWKHFSILESIKCTICKEHIKYGILMHILSYSVIRLKPEENIDVNVFKHTVMLISFG